MQSRGRQTCSARSQDDSTLKLRSAPYPLTIWSFLMSKIAAVLAKAVRLMTRSYVTLYRKTCDGVGQNTDAHHSYHMSTSQEHILS
eukprot:scaffold9065_cov94-Skeletonema_dohrnii-CCMP3373.AAC.1